jgi:mannose-6-phosphate isomerase
LKADGKEYKLSAGYIFFIGQNTELAIKATKALKSFTAFAE